MHSSWACCIVGYFIPHCILAHSVKFSRSSGCFTHTGNLHEEIERKVLFQKLMTQKIYSHISIQFNSYLKWLFQKVFACIKRVWYEWVYELQDPVQLKVLLYLEETCLKRCDGGRCRSLTHTYTHTQVGLLSFPLITITQHPVTMATPPTSVFQWDVFIILP